MQAVRRNGGLATAKRMLSPRNRAQRAGLDALLNAGRPDLTLEAIVLRPKFRSLFSPDELSEDQIRLGSYEKDAEKRKAKSARLYPDELEPDRKYIEGGRKEVRVNAYERDPQAQAACLKHHGYRYAVCDLSFEDEYGEIGKGFIHVHHLKPLALTNPKYELDPVKDLRPVCPSCHAMLHRGDPPLTIPQLRRTVSKKAG